MKTLILLTVSITLAVVVATPARPFGRAAEKPSQKGNVTLLCLPLPKNLPEAMQKLQPTWNLASDEGKFQLRDNSDESGEEDSDSDSVEDDDDERILRDDSSESEEDSDSDSNESDDDDRKLRGGSSESEEDSDSDSNESDDDDSKVRSDESDEDSDESDEDSNSSSVEASDENNALNIIIPPSCDDILNKPCNQSVVCLQIPQEMYDYLQSLGMNSTSKQSLKQLGTEEQGTYDDIVSETDDYETYTDYTVHTETPSTTVYYDYYVYDDHWHHDEGWGSWPWKLVQQPEEDVRKHFGSWRPPATPSVSTLCNSWQTYSGTVSSSANSTAFETFFTSFCNTNTRIGVAVPEAIDNEAEESRIFKALRNAGV